MTQPRALSLIEATFKAVIGFVSALCIQVWLLPSYGCKMQLQDNIQFGFWFILNSIAVGYIVRRLFERKVR